MVDIDIRNFDGGSRILNHGMLWVNFSYNEQPGHTFGESDMFNIIKTFYIS